jgi:hypothetical protein
MNRFFKKLIEVTLENTEDFIDLIDNHWVYMYLIVIISFIQQIGIFLMIHT